MAPEPLTLFDIVPGRELAGRYTVVGSNRQGGFSTAFEVKDTDGQSCEMQLFPAALFDEDDQADEFVRGMQPWLEVSSASVLGVREIFEIESGILAFVTDLPAGESLRARLDREKILTRDEILAIGIAVLEGLDEIHGRGLVHGDIKPYTIHVTGTGDDTQPLLVDGGVTPGLWTAKDLGAKTALIGTPYYAPVEQFGGDAPDVRSDVYNMATVLYESATGLLPWAGKTFLEIFQAKLQDPPPMRERGTDIQVDDEFDRAIRKGCFADRRKRYESAAGFKQALEAIR